MFITRPQTDRHVLATSSLVEVGRFLSATRQKTQLYGDKHRGGQVKVLVLIWLPNGAPPGQAR
jgi:hypothetical protein